MKDRLWVSGGCVTQRGRGVTSKMGIPGRIEVDIVWGKSGGATFTLYPSPDITDGTVLVHQTELLGIKTEKGIFWGGRLGKLPYIRWPYDKDGNGKWRSLTGNDKRKN